MIKLSLVIPCFNEAESLPRLLEMCAPLLNRADCQLVLVDNGSTDATGDLLLDSSQRYSQLKVVTLDQNMGYGGGILSGLRQAEGAILGWTHADLQTDPRAALEALPFFDDNPNDIFVKGRRFGRSMGDRLFTHGMSLICSFIFGRIMIDINAQPTLFSRIFFESWSLPPEDFSLDLYTYYHAKKRGLRVIRFPTYFGPRVFGSSKWNFGISSRARFIRRTLNYTLILRLGIGKK
ncbi:glycosyltransferase family 2 protein [Luminiphilus sp.]|nr:glycosyltransferase family 2 protein [Luminiphilus sp.]